MIGEDVRGLAVRCNDLDVGLRVVVLEVGSNPRADRAVRRHRDRFPSVGAHDCPFPGNLQPARSHSRTVNLGFGFGGVGLVGNTDFDRLSGAFIAATSAVWVRGVSVLLAPPRSDLYLLFFR